ncbi:hypothetical protein GCM10009745_20830 [Kribbella yunnanensis]|uniref:Uncharacterized protein n=1 Tax=Kribbella yunnanensis TaxID=190194 RepID=A0ABP4SSK3_9ACTN
MDNGTEITLDCPLPTLGDQAAQFARRPDFSTRIHVMKDYFGLPAAVSR